jgi:hypothetical protein
MKTKLSWTLRDEDRVKRETRVEVTEGNIKWQFKRADEEKWDYDRNPVAQDWDELEEIMERRRGRGRAVKMSEIIKRARREAGW